MNVVREMDFDSFQREFQYLTFRFRYLSTPFFVSCLLQYRLPDLVSHLCHYKWQPSLYLYK